MVGGRAYTDCARTPILHLLRIIRSINTKEQVINTDKSFKSDE